ncbi:MAG TPA: hypothetical protein VFP84_07250 [Kofleriaceae bacterium]|nr:hypothetical protein [Kofleriaceae bacterium]
MKRSICDQVAERVALGESLGELAGHAMSCASCQGLMAVSSQLGAVHHDVDPGLGFTARMTVGAQHRLGVRRRRKLAVGFAATIACGAFGVFVVTHTPEEASNVARPAMATHGSDQPAAAPDAGDATEDLTSLVRLADVDHSRNIAADWSAVEAPLAPYKKLLKGVTP